MFQFFWLIFYRSSSMYSRLNVAAAIQPCVQRLMQPRLEPPLPDLTSSIYRLSSLLAPVSRNLTSQKSDNISLHSEDSIALLSPSQVFPLMSVSVARRTRESFQWCRLSSIAPRSGSIAFGGQRDRAVTNRIAPSCVVYLGVHFL